MGRIYMVNGCGLKNAGARPLCCSSVLENKGPLRQRGLSWSSFLQEHGRWVYLPLVKD